MEANNKTKKDILYISMSDECGQIKIEDAANELFRLNAMNIGKWVKDFTPYLYVVDETDENVNNPCKLNDGYCWLVRKGTELNKGEGIEDDLDKDVAILEADLWNQPTGAPQVKEDIPEGDFLFFNWSKAPASNFNNRTNIMDGGDKIFVIEHYSDDKDKRTAIDTLLLSAPQLARNNKALISIVKELKQRNEELVKALEEVVRISDRKHDAWDKAKAALQQNK